MLYQSKHWVGCWTGGVILKTTDGGANWFSQTSGTYYRLNDIFYLDDNNGWIVGVGSLILRTSDGGTTWNPQPNNANQHLRGVSFSDINNGFVVGDAGRILNTTNGGTSWSLQASGTYDDLFSVFCIDANNAVVVGGETFSSKILTTSNGGSNWSSQSSLSLRPLSDVYFTDFLNGTAVGEYGTILRTTDGGVTYILQTSQSEFPDNFLLSQNYPNPFNPSTKIRYEIPERSFVSIKVYDLLGNEIATLVNEEKPAGTYEVEFNFVRTSRVLSQPSGIYFYQLKAGNFVETKKMVLLK